ncbi:hypothetical protein [Streptomyces wuyuanensis]|uniref:hypothetical protein n=1 Tax=Streptomyces wuyuanensis TaxID=1196353 RepID=UPI003419C3A0
MTSGMPAHERQGESDKLPQKCHHCRTLQAYPEDFVQPGEPGYNPERRLCRYCVTHCIL